MPHLASVASLLDFLPVEPSIRAEAEDLLVGFAALPDKKKVSAQASLLPVIFPLVFRGNALVEGSPKYEESRTQPW